MFTDNTSFPIGRVLPTAVTRATVLDTKVRRERQFGRLTPRRIVFISGIPDPMKRERETERDKERQREEMERDSD